MKPVQNLNGFLGLSGAAAQDFQVSATMPAGTTCSGGPNGNACLVRVQNPNKAAGPFGGCTIVSNANSTAAAPAAAAPAAGGAAGKKRLVSSRIITGGSQWI